MQPRMRGAMSRMTDRAMRLLLLVPLTVPVPGRVVAEPVPAEIRALADTVRDRFAKELSGSRFPAVTVGLDALVTVPERGRKEVRPLAGVSAPAVPTASPPPPRAKPPVPDASRKAADEAPAAASVARIGTVHGPVHGVVPAPPGNEALNGPGSRGVPR